MDDLSFIDIGCGTLKQPGAIGVDVLAAPGVDRVCDLDRAPLPFDDNSVGRTFSSHCIEHVQDPIKLLREITRVSAHGARVELWHPYSGHRDAFLFDHRNFLNEQNYLHMSSLGPAYWAGQLGAWWKVEELVYAISGDVLAELEDAEIDADFAIKYLSNVVLELGVMATIDKHSTPPQSAPPPRRVYAVSRKPEDRRELVRPPTRKRPTPPPATTPSLGDVLRKTIRHR